MKAADIPENEELRLRELRQLGALEEQAYDDLTQLASQICDTPVALVSLIDSNSTIKCESVPGEKTVFYFRLVIDK